MLSSLDISVFLQGSYRARTNVREDSAADYGRVPSDISYVDYKNLVERALVDYLGQSSVRRGDKAFDVHANTYRVDADVIAAFEHRRYFRDETNRWLTGIGLKQTLIS